MLPPWLLTPQIPTSSTRGLMGAASSSLLLPKAPHPFTSPSQVRGWNRDEQSIRNRLRFHLYSVVQQGTTVTLTATPSSGSVFAGWLGACSGTGDCVVTMDDDKSVTATFNLEGGYSLTVVKAGTGDGAVTSSPAGISCGSACSQAFQKITKVKLTAKANSDSIFTGWSGGGYSGTKPCQVTVDHAIAITASFEKKVPHISVSLNTLDFGSVKMGKSLKKTLKIMNNGTGDLSVSIGGVGGTDFSVAGKTNITVKPNKSYNLGITFKPGSTGVRLRPWRSTQTTRMPQPSASH